MAKTSRKKAPKKIAKKPAKKSVKKAANKPLTVYGYLIVEKDGSDMYAYYEHPKHYAVTEPQRARTMFRVTASDLANQCDLSDFGRAVYLVQEIHKDDPVFHYV
jgi:hypothetical protein